MIKLKNVTIRNFMSVGNVSQGVVLDNDPIVLVLGENRDLGGNGNRNGVGKSTIVNAITYALYGGALTNIKLNNLINKTNGKNMFVTIEFTNGNDTYKLERGRKPDVFNMYINGSNPYDNDAQGNNRLTQKDVEAILGMNKTLFSNIVALNTFNEPFLSMKAAPQREMMELLLGMTKLSEKAVSLKENIKDTKDEVKEEEYKIKSIDDSNSVIQRSKDSLASKSSKWETTREQNLVDLTSALSLLSEMNIEDELENHRLLGVKKEADTLYREASTNLNILSKDCQALIKERDREQRHLDSATEGVCHACNQVLPDDNTTETKKTHAETIEELNKAIEELEAGIAILTADVDSMATIEAPTVFYSTYEEAYNHQIQIRLMADELEKEMNSTNPYVDQITELDTSIKKADFTRMEQLVAIRDHQDFLLKLLTNKDSFIRKKIIDQNLSFLNDRLRHYLETIGLPHSVVFNPNLDVYITEYGRDLDFDNLSRGEKTRLILSLSWAFRDVYESMNGSINLLFIDELLDSGLDASGTESTLAALKVMAHEQNKNVILISHREELVGKVDNIITVCKENGFTRIETSEL